MLKIKKNKLFWKIFLLLFVGIMVVTSIFGLFSLSLQKNSIIKLLYSEGRSIAQSISFVTSDALIIDDASYIVEFNFEYIKNNEKIKNIIISKVKNEYFNIEKQKWSFQSNLDPIYKKMQENVEKFDFIISPILNEKVFHYTYPIYFSGVHWGWIHLSFDIKDYVEKIQNLYLIFVYLFLTLSIVSLVISYYVANIFSTPIIKLNQSASLVAQGNLSIRSDVKRDDEIGELAQTFNIMVNNLEESQLQLRYSYEGLEKRVEDRTHELKETNEKLELKTKELAELNTNLDYKVKNEIVKRREQEKILIQQSRLAAMGEMIGNIAHQWRQPLNAIGLIIQNIHFAHSKGDLTQEFLDDSMRKGNQLTSMMSKTINDFRNFFQPNKQKEEFHLNQAVSSTLELIKASFTHYNIKVRYQNIEDVIVYGFPNEFAQALLNIFSNAKDAVIENDILEAFIDIDIKKEGKYGVIYIHDNAGGIPPEILEKIFDPYFTTKHQSHGTGIGLYMSKIIVEQNMQGLLIANNENGGALFKISVPLKKV